MKPAAPDTVVEKVGELIQQLSNSMEPESVHALSRGLDRFRSTVEIKN